jgi:hypothetical protein
MKTRRVGKMALKLHEIAELTHDERIRYALRYSDSIVHRPEIRYYRGRSVCGTACPGARPSFSLYYQSYILFYQKRFYLHTDVSCNLPKCLCETILLSQIG